MEAQGVELGEGDELMGGVDGEDTSLRKKKSRKFGGGAATMHAFNKSCPLRQRVSTVHVGFCCCSWVVRT
jgi:hypothetical protein